MQSRTAKELSTVVAKPILKWAGGKTQMLSELLPKVPPSYGRYIEPFFGGGALFFALQPEKAIVADSNPELINMYRQVAEHVDDVISYLKKYENTSEMFYSVRGLDWETLPKAEAAARTIYLNKTCYNGLYRVNKKGQFNVPYGKYKNPKICDAEALWAASELSLIHIFWRARPRSASRFWWRRSPTTSAPGRSCGAATVSYTHLDVYKRQ